MAGWTQYELAAVGEAEELEIAPARGDRSLRRATPIWVVRVGDQLFIRSYRGQNGRWFQAAQQSHEGEISAGGLRKRVRFIETDETETQEAIDGAYRLKYGRYGARYVDPMIAVDTRATTLALVPVGADR
jgi:hypothetical protein